MRARMDHHGFATIADVAAGRRLSRRRALLGATGVAAALLGSGRPRFVAVAVEGATPAAGSGFSIQERTKLDAILDKHVTETKTPGAVAGVWIPGRGTWVKAIGNGNLATGDPLAIDDRIRIASITKTFVATAVLQLVDAGKLGLDDVLETYVPGVPNGETATIRQLLNMTSGIFGFVEDETFAAAFDEDPLMDFTPEEGIDIARRHEPYFAPGTGFHYSDTNYLLLGVIVEQVTGKAIETAIAEQILTPLGLNDTSFPTTPEIPEPYARGYFKDPATGEVRDVTRSNPAVSWTAGAMFSTLDDLKIWAEAVATGRLLQPATQAARLETVPIAPGSPSTYGLGLFEVLGFIGHNGGILGYSTFMVHRPEDGATIVTATNLSDNEGGGADAIFAGILALLYPELLST
jgi:D-alanyl-D-alanine carboxypeptidase